MIPKGIKKWPTETTANNIPPTYHKPTQPLSDFEISISTRHIVRENIEVGIKVFCYIVCDNVHLFELSTHSKFLIPNPLNEEATLQFIYGCLVDAIQDFNQVLSKNNSELLKHPENKNAYVKQRTPSYDEARPSILRIWSLDVAMN